MLNRQSVPYLAVAGLCVAVGMGTIIAWSEIGIADALVVFGLVVCAGSALLVIETKGSRILSAPRAPRRPSPSTAAVSAVSIDVTEEESVDVPEEGTSLLLHIQPTEGGFDVSAQNTEGSIRVLAELPFSPVDRCVIDGLQTYLEDAPRATTVGERRDMAAKALADLDAEHIAQLAAFVDPLQEFACQQGGQRHTCSNMRRVIAAVSRVPAATIDLRVAETEHTSTD